MSTISTRRLLSSVGWEVKIQFRYGFYYAAAIAMLVWITALWFVSDQILSDYLAAFLISNLNIGTFFFVAALIMFEKGENTLDALVITPLRREEYMLSKIISLTILAVVENLIIVVALLWGAELNWAVVILSIILISAINILFGIGFVAKYRDFASFIFPAILVVIFLEFPIFQFFGLTSPVFQFLYLLTPVQPIMILMGAATGTLTTVQWLYAIGGSIVWLALASFYAIKRYRKYIILKEVA